MHLKFYLKTDTHFTIQRRVEGWIELLLLLTKYWLKWRLIKLLQGHFT